MAFRTRNVFGSFEKRTPGPRYHQPAFTTIEKRLLSILLNQWLALDHALRYRHSPGDKITWSHGFSRPIATDNNSQRGVTSRHLLCKREDALVFEFSRGPRTKI